MQSTARPHLTMRCVRYLAALAVLVCAPFALSAENCADPKSLSIRGSEFQLFVENDMLANSDRYYTNGIKFGIGVPGDTLAELFCHASQPLLGLFSSEKGQIQFGWFLGQTLYTPQTITIAAPQPADRPWAAWLYMGAVAQRVNSAETKLDVVEIDIGMVGPAALGDQVQSSWHSFVGSPKPLGWGNQIPNELAFLVSYLHKQKALQSKYFELIPHAGVIVGNVFTLARAGAIVRFGVNMTGFGPDTIEPGGAMLQNTRGAAAPDADKPQKVQTPSNKRDDIEAYGFVGFDGRLVARNIFLDGTMFRDSPSVTRRDYVHDLSVGISGRYRSLRISFTRVLRSEEFYTATSWGGKQTFNSLNIGFEF